MPFSRVHMDTTADVATRQSPWLVARCHPRRGIVSWKTVARDADVGRALDLLIHDVRTPLGVVIGYLRLISSSLVDTREASLGTSEP
jgi:signal transduction histidine kinase